MANPFDSMAAADGEEEKGFLVRDLLRFFAVDIITIILIRLLVGLGFFERPDSHVLALLASKAALLGYLVWLVRNRSGAWPETGAAAPGRWWAWPASLVAYAACYPLILWTGMANQQIMEKLYAAAGWAYTPPVQLPVILIFEEIVETPVRLSLVLFTVLVGPFMEELAFRGIGLDAFRRSFGVAWGVFWTSLLFGLYHFEFRLLIPLSLLGALFAGVRILTGSLWCAIFVHCLHNAATLAVTAHTLGRFPAFS